jgi:hypothetical protein
LVAGTVEKVMLLEIKRWERNRKGEIRERWPVVVSAAAKKRSCRVVVL